MASVWKLAVESKRRGGVCWHLRWREDGRTRGLSLKTGSEAKADAAVSRKRQELLAAAPRTRAAAAGGRPLDALEGFLGSLRAQGRSPRTIAYYDQKLRPLFTVNSAAPLGTWTRAVLEAHINAHPAWSGRTRQMVVTSCRTFIGWAQDAGCMPEGCDFVGRLRIQRDRREEHSVLTRDQVEDLLAGARGIPRISYLETPIALGAYAGLAESDWRGLTWDNVDLERGVLQGRRSKTHRRYVVGICPALAAILTRQRALSGPVCRRLPSCTRSPYHALRRLQVRVGVPPAPKGENGWHRLRHTFLTWLADAGVPDHERRLAAGHAPGSPMAARYTHPDDARTVDAVRRALG